MIKVHIAVPTTMDINKFVASYCLSELNRVNEHPELEIEVDYNFRSAKPIDSNRNAIVADFLSTDADFLWFIDSDNPPVKSAIHLAKLDRDVLIFPTPIWSCDGDRYDLSGYPVVWNCMDYQEKSGGWTEHDPKKGLQEVDAGGTGSMMIARRVLESVTPAFEREFNDIGVAHRGSDFLFCKRAKDAGFKVFAHYDYPCHHFKVVDLIQVTTMLTHRDASACVWDNINTPEYWDDKWKGIENYNNSQFTGIYKRISDTIRDESVLDFGCGSGDFLLFLGDNAEGIDYSPEAIKLCDKVGVKARVGCENDIPDIGSYDIITVLNTLQLIDNDRKLIKDLFAHTDKLIYTVPNNCMPPGQFREHRRVYTPAYIEEITPHVRTIEVCGNYVIVTAER
jgi:hypothetical protein